MKKSILFLQPPIKNGIIYKAVKKGNSYSFTEESVNKDLIAQDLSEDLPEEGMYPDYEPEEVIVPDDYLLDREMPINEPEIEEEEDLMDDEYTKDSDYDTFEGEIGEIEADQESISSDIY